MYNSDELLGQLLIAIPKTAHTTFANGVLLVTAHWPAGSAAVMVNKRSMGNFNVGHIMKGAGIDFDIHEPIYWGGPDEPNRVQFVHTLDWQCASTKQITGTLGVTQELSILAAIADSEGPKQWRCIGGHRLLGPDVLEGEMAGMPPWQPNHRWMTIPAMPELVFGEGGEEQWLNALNSSSKLQISNWF